MKFTMPGTWAEATAALRRGLDGLPAQLKAKLPSMPLGRLDPRQPQPGQPQPATDPGQFLQKMFSAEAGGRPYKLYIPTGYHGQKVPLIVMLHGCTQSPDDFAAGTRMNAAAETRTCLVAWPAQTRKANMQKCWNWFNPDDQRRDSGEAALIAGITRQVMRDYTVDPDRVYVAGLSAGGAAASIMGETYPDLFAAIGVHSGLACGCARDLPSALAAMKSGGSGSPRRPGRKMVPSIVFHGDQDSTVNPNNGDSVMAQAMDGAGLTTRLITETAGGQVCVKTLYTDAHGTVMAEKWVVRGAGHAWFGGSPAGSFTAPQGPDATREMMRFFLAHPRRVA
jgi:poly(hydroxyalkanoate) depolymerase family esterase